MKLQVNAGTINLRGVVRIVGTIVEDAMLVELSPTTPIVGSAVTCTVTGGIAPIIRQWKRDGANIDSANGEMYIPVIDDANTRLSCEVTDSDTPPQVVTVTATIDTAAHAEFTASLGRTSRAYTGLSRPILRCTAAGGMSGYSYQFQLFNTFATPSAWQNAANNSTGVSGVPSHELILRTAHSNTSFRCIVRDSSDPQLNITSNTVAVGSV